MKLEQLFEVKDKKSEFSTGKFVKKVAELIKTAGNNRNHFKKPKYLSDGEFLEALMVGHKLSKDEATAMFYTRESAMRVNSGLEYASLAYQHNQITKVKDYAPKDYSEACNFLANTDGFNEKLLKLEEFCTTAWATQEVKKEVEEALREFGMEMF